MIKRMRMNKKIIFWIFFGAFLILYLIPLWQFEFLPFVDYPHHLAIAHMLRQYDHPETAYSEFYTLRFLGRGCVALPLFLHFVSTFVSMNTAGKLFISLYAVLLPLAMYFFIKTRGGNRWFSLFSFIFIYNFSLMWGLLSFVMAVPFFFFALALGLRLFKTGIPAIKTLLLFSGVCLLLFFIHAAVYCMFLGVFSVAAGIYGAWKKPYKKILIALLPSLLCAVPFMVTFLTTYYHEMAGGIDQLSFTFSRSVEKIVQFSAYMVFRSRSGIYACYFFVAIAIFLIIRGVKEKSLGVRKEVIIIMTMLCILGGFYVLSRENRIIMDKRTAVFIPLCILCLIPCVKLKEKVFMVYFLSLLLCGVWMSIFKSFSRFNALVIPVKKVLSHAEPYKYIVGLQYPNSFRSPLAYDSFRHTVCYYQVWQDGLCAYLFPDIVSWHVFQRKKQKDPFIVDDGRIREYIFPEGWQKYDYFLICGIPYPEDSYYFNALRLKAQEGIWTLYEKR